MAASNTTFVFLFIIGAFVPIALATEFLVGDDSGWTIGFDYKAWTQGKDFRVGDKLVFKYKVGNHNVVKVNGTGFNTCVAPAGSVELATGNDVVTLATPGRKWYICNVGQHCEWGQKLVITVSSDSQAPAPSPPGSTPPSYSMNGVTA